MSKHLLTVMTHAGAHETFMRHYYEWQKHGTDILVFTPDEPYPQINVPHEVLKLGRAQHHGAESIRRFRNLLTYLAGKPHESFSIFEYDSFCLSVGIPGFNPDGLSGHVFRDDQPNRGFVGTYYVHPPLVFSAPTLRRILKSAQHVRDDAECGFWDRWLGWVCEREGIQFQNYLASYGFSRNTIEPPEIPAAVAAVNNGAVTFHGVKTKECYDAIKAAYSNLLRRSR